MWASYIGLPWSAGGQGPQEFDCMGFFRMVQKKHFAIEVPQVIAPDYNDPTVLADLFGRHEERANWRRIERPEHGCAVLVHRPMHIGTWLNIDGGGVIHCVRHVGVIFTHDSSWKTSGFGRREFFRHTL
jgi:hypothetical protein